MGLLSFLFGGGTKEKPKAAAKPAAKSPPKTADKPKVAASVSVLPVAARKTPAVGVLPLRLNYASKLRAGDAAGAYQAACALASFYKKARVPALAAEYRAAAEERLADMLGGRRVMLAAKSPRAVARLGVAQAGLIAAHRDFAAKFGG